nr:ribosomal protein L30/L7 family protein [Tanacetum cinerariifolium]
MMLRNIVKRIVIGSSERLRTKRFLCTKNNIEPNKNESLTHHDSYRDLDKLDFMTASKILFTTPPKQKKFGLDFHLVQLFFVCLPSLAVYLVAQYARHEMKKMDAQLEKMKIEEAKKVKAAEEDVIKSNPQLLEVKERLDSLEKTVKEMVTESKTQQSIKVSEQHEGHKTQLAGKAVAEDRSNKQASNKQETQETDNQNATQEGPLEAVSLLSVYPGSRGRICLHFISPIPCSGGIGYIVVVYCSSLSVQPVELTIMAEEEPKPLNFVNEIVLKKRKNNEDWANRRKEQLEQRVKKSKSDNFVIKKPEQFIREYRDKEADLIKMKHRGKRPVKASMFPQSKLLFVIRIQGITSILEWLFLTLQYLVIRLVQVERTQETADFLEMTYLYGESSLSNTLEKVSTILPYLII